MKENILKDKAYKFALRTVKLYRFLANEKKEFVISKQDFIHKLSISQKESFETHYRIRLLRDSEFLNEKLADSLLKDCEELQKLTTSSIKTTKSNL